MTEKITMLVTSCDRLDLLDKTLRSFFALNTYPIEKLILHEDRARTCGDRVVNLMKRICPQNLPTTIVLSHGRGLSASLDLLFNMAETDLVFTCENDWHFQGNPNFMEDSVKLLKALPSVHQVWIRNKNDHGHPLGKIHSQDGVLFRHVQKGYKDNWGGFSWNPGLRRKKDWAKMFPKGYAEYGDEILCNHVANIHNYTAVSLVNTACRHIGYGRHTNGFVL